MGKLYGKPVTPLYLKSSMLEASSFRGSATSTSSCCSQITLALKIIKIFISAAALDLKTSKDIFDVQEEVPKMRSEILSFVVILILVSANICVCENDPGPIL